ncbi:MAG: AAA family ATPase [Candidatus Thermoplasmatota archaeon]|nr:AAA family ATPase [Candidatus Thermoplasmatota archaeon]MBU1914582.1 AAA family ATPase [Candidatus Thermoplasmatota archaeon]
MVLLRDQRHTMIKDKVKTGAPGLDDMLEGGLIPGRAYVVSGTSGTGKTTLAMQFLLEGARCGERVVYVSIDEPPNEVKQNMGAFGWDIGRIQVFDATPDVMNYDKTPVRDVSTERKVVYFSDIGPGIRQTSDRNPVDMTISTLQEILKQEMRARKYSRIVVDSITSLRYFYIRTSEENTTLMSFFRLLSDLGVTALLTVQLPEISKPDVEVHVARGDIRLHKWFDGRGLMRGITVEKYRGSSHDQRLRMMKISSAGIDVKTQAPEKREEASDEESPHVAGSADLPEPPPPSDEALAPPAEPTPAQPTGQSPPSELHPKPVVHLKDGGGI